MAAADIEQTQPEVTGPKIELSAEREAEYERITRNLAEMTSGEILRKVLSEDRTVKCYWGKSAVCRTLK
jgi:tyrosyl-tRNA synthetase